MGERGRYPGEVLVEFVIARCPEVISGQGFEPRDS